MIFLNLKFSIKPVCSLDSQELQEWLESSVAKGIFHLILQFGDINRSVNTLICLELLPLLPIYQIFTSFKKNCNLSSHTLHCTSHIFHMVKSKWNYLLFLYKTVRYEVDPEFNVITSCRLLKCLIFGFILYLFGFRIYFAVNYCLQESLNRTQNLICIFKHSLKKG